jgi:hypothetical protein
MAIFREYFTGSTDGTPIAITSTDSAGAQTIHTCSTKKGEIYLFIHSASTAVVESFVEWGSTVGPIRTLISPGVGAVPISPGLPLRNGKVIKAYGSTVSTSALFATGWVNELSS